MRKKFFLWTKSFFFKTLRAVAVGAVAVGAVDNIPMPAPPKAIAVAESTGATGTCDEILPAEVEAASKGLMDMGAMAMVGQTANTAVSATEDGGGSAKLAHQGSMAINGTMSAYALSVYDSCTSAFTACETACAVGEEKDAVLSNCPKEGAEICSKYGPGETPPSDLSVDCSKVKANCEDHKTKILAQCTSAAGACDQALIQAGLSLANVGISLMALRALRGDDDGGDECEEGEDCPDENTTPLPDFRSSSLPTATTNSPNTSPGEDEKKTNQEFTPPEKPEEKKTTVAKKEKGEKYKPTKEGTGSDNTMGLASALGGQKSATPSNSAGGLGSSGLGRGLSSASNNDGEPLMDDEDDEDWRRNNPGITGAFSGGLTSQPANVRGGAGGLGGPSQRGKSGKKNKNKKWAQASKKKGDIFAKAGAHSSIFEKMSQIIQSYCGKEKGNCSQK